MSVSRTGSHPADAVAVVRPLRSRWSRRVALVLAAGAALLAGCATDKPKPLPLEPIAAPLPGRQVWSGQVGGSSLALSVVARDGAFIVADDDGLVQSLEAATGRVQWRARFGTRLSAAIGSDGRFVAAVSRDNELIVLDAGREVWRKRLNSAVSTAPLVAGERVFVVGVDRQVQAFDALDGRRLWVYARPGGEALSLSQRAVLQAWRDTLLVGQGAVLVALDPTRGSVRSETALTPPRGTNEVERLNDLVGPAVRLGDTLCVRAFQTAIGCYDLNRARVRWSRLAGGVQALAGDADLLFGADASDRISAWKTAGGELAWTNERLLYRGLGAGLSVGRTVVFADAEGQVHVLAREDGRTLWRLTTDGSAPAAPPVQAGGTVLVVTRKGGLYAFRPE